MDIGTQKRVIIVEPQKTPTPAKTPATQPAEPAKVR